MTENQPNQSQKTTKKRTKSNSLPNFDLSCEICTLPYNEEQQKPISLPCGHTLCESCLGIIHNESIKLACPFDRKEFNSSNKSVNYALLKLVISMKSEAKSNEIPENPKPTKLKLKSSMEKSKSSDNNLNSIIKTPSTKKKYTGKCPNNDLLKWTNLKHVCMDCNGTNHGMHCWKCGYHYCSTCINNIQTNSKKCPGKHDLNWTLSRYTCFSCDQISHGIHCNDCGYHRCTLCSNISLTNTKKCPNNHSLKWTASIYTCINCNMINHGMYCSECRYHLCSNCANITTLSNSKKCPNNHPIKWLASKYQCTLCSQTSHGLHCGECEYHYCSKCANLSFTNLKKCPNNHAIKWIPSKYNCFNCNAIHHGLHCQDCGFHYCSKPECANISVTNTKKCPNNHPLKWIPSRQACIKCSQIHHGLHCDECQYHICSKSQCANIPVASLSKKCPNNHPLKWTPSKHMCINCNMIHHGVHCVECKYHLCSGPRCANISVINPKKCPNNHALKWTPSKHPCINCNQLNHGMHCDDCAYHLCSKPQCANVSIINSKKCPNNHQLKWISSKHVCINCNQSNHGMHCDDCGYHLCTKPQCANISVLNSKKCPNNHPLKWTSLKHECINCNQTNHGMHCTDCNYHFCSATTCAKTLLSNLKKCPNDHQLKWTLSLHYCTNCGKSNSGLHCSECNYHICSKSTCANIDLTNSKLCPNNHLLKWTSARYPCSKCGQINHGLHCFDCGHHTCSGYFCSRISLTNARECPNKDPLRWTSNPYYCNNCFQIYHGMHCDDCGYHFCSGSYCAKVFLGNPRNCPNGDNLEWSFIKYNCHNCNKTNCGNHCIDCGYHICSQCTKS